MGKTKTLDFLKTSTLAVITCADEKPLANFFKFISAAPNFSNAEIKIENYINTAIPSNEVSQKLAELIGNNDGKKTFVPLKCETYSKLRSIYFHLPDTVNPDDVQIFVLRETETGFKLECELGVLQGIYCLYDYDNTTGKFTEKESWRAMNLKNY